MTQPPAFGTGDASYQAAGGIDGLRRLVDDFYRLMDERPEAAALRALHPADLSAARDKLACFLSGWLGGPDRFRPLYGEPFMRRRHMAFPIDSAARDAWMAAFRKALDEVVDEPGLHAWLLARFQAMADHLRNRADSSAPQAHTGCCCSTA